MDWKKGFGVIIAVIGTLAPIAAGLYYTENLYCLWALIAVAMVAGIVKSSDNAIILGLLAILAGAVVTVAVVVSANPYVLWALVGVALIVSWARD